MYLTASLALVLVGMSLQSWVICTVFNNTKRIYFVTTKSNQEQECRPPNYETSDRRMQSRCVVVPRYTCQLRPIQRKFLADRMHEKKSCDAKLEDDNDETLLNDDDVTGKQNCRGKSRTASCHLLSPCTNPQGRSPHFKDAVEASLCVHRYTSPCSWQVSLLER